MPDSNPRHSAEFNNGKASNTQDLETQMTAVGSGPSEFMNSTFLQKLVFEFMDVIVADLLSACLKVVDDMP